MLIYCGRLFTMFVPPLPTFIGAGECGKHTSTEGHRFLSRSRNHHHNNLHQHSCRSRTFILPSNPCHSLYASIPPSPPPHHCWLPTPEATAALEPTFATRTPMAIDTRLPCGDPCEPIFHSGWIEAVFAVVWPDSCIGKPLMGAPPTTAFGGGGGLSRTGDGKRCGNRDGGCVVRCEGGRRRRSISAPFLA